MLLANLFTNRIISSVLIAGTSVAAYAQTKPPTVDPTYGFPLPKHVASAAKPLPDAQWIWAANTSDKQTVYLRKAFTLRGKPQTARLFVTADNYFTAYLNGTQLGGTQLEQGNDFVWAKVRSYDVVEVLKTGGNLLAIEGVNEGGQAAVLARLEIDGKPAIFSDGSWKVAEAESEAWTTPEFSDATWASATVLGPASSDPWGGRLEGWPAPLTPAAPYLQHLPIPPVSIAVLENPTSLATLTWHSAQTDIEADQPVSGKPWAVLLDFGKELDGRIELKSNTAQQVTAGTGESDGEAVEKPYTTSDLDLTVGHPAYGAYSAFRYVKLTFPATQNHVSLTVSLDHLYYPVQYRGSFDCSDPLLTRVWYTGAYTAHACMQEDIWDAPKRDRMRWMGDLHVSGEVINNVFADKFLMEQTMTRLRQAAQGSHDFTSLPKNHVNDIPGYSCAWIAGLADFHRHIGDMAYLKSQHDALVSMLAYFQGEFDEDHVFVNKLGKWPFVDWAPDFNADGPMARATTQLFMVHAYREASFLFAEMGDRLSSAIATAWADEVTKSAQAHLADPTGTFSDRRQENAMAIYSGVATYSQTKIIYDHILDPGSAAWNKVATPYYNNYVLFAMSEAGHTQAAMDFVRSYWGGMLAEGATTWWEGYDPSWDKNNFHAHLQADNGTGYFVSLSHGWSAGPTNFLTERVLGVRPTSGGFRTCDIAPDLGDLAWASGTVPTPRGDLTVKVVKRGHLVDYRFAIPRGTTARVRLLGQLPGTDTKPLGETATTVYFSTTLKAGHYGYTLVVPEANVAPKG